MKLILKSKEFIRKLDVYLDIPLHIPTIKQLDPLDPKNIIWKKLRLPLHIKLTRQITEPIITQLQNTPI